MVHVYANLIGTWHDLEVEDPHTKMGIHMSVPTIWWEENADIYNPTSVRRPNTMYELPYVELNFKGVDYRISPYWIQIVED